MDVKFIRLKVQVIVEPDDDGWHAYCPDLKGLHVGGDTKDEALGNAMEAVKLYLSSLVKHNEPIPIGVQDGEWSLAESVKGLFAPIFRPSRAKVLSEVQLAVPA